MICSRAHCITIGPCMHARPVPSSAFSRICSVKAFDSAAVREEIQALKCHWFKWIGRWKLGKIMDCMDCLFQDVCIWTFLQAASGALSPGVVSTEEVPTWMLVYLMAIWIFGCGYMRYIWYMAMVYGLFVVCVCLLVYMQSVMRWFVCGCDVDICMAWIFWIYRRHVFDITLISFMLQQNLDVAAYI